MEKRTMKNNKQFDLQVNEYYKNSQFDINTLNCEKEFWEINETISELSYLTHNYFRYYGKFPSKIGKLIINELKNNNHINSDQHFIFDNYAGSGTTLVESKLEKFDSIGIDINPFAVLACRVKTNNFKIPNLKKIWKSLKEKLSKYNKADCYHKIIDVSIQDDPNIKSIINVSTETHIENPDFNKWFSDKTIEQLSVIKYYLLQLPYSVEREFFDLGFFSIIRRVSRAHDAEVRPHVNKNKKQRNVIDVYIKKIEEMLGTMCEWNKKTDKNVYANAFTIDNSKTNLVNNLIDNTRQLTGKELGAVISHPPYLNCFDYIPVFKLKFMWSKGFKEIYDNLTYNDIKNAEIKSYPVNNHNAINRYFEHNYRVYKNIYDILNINGYCCIVIGDCTVKRQMFHVHKAFITMMAEIGFTLKKIVYRSTAYGMGKYAYKHRADYSASTNGKQDAILFFKKNN